MTEAYFRPLTEETRVFLEMTREMLEDDPGWLDREDCPYPSWVCEMFVARETVSEERDESEVDLVAETTSLFNELRNAKDNFTVNDHAERMSYFRTSTSLLEKLVGMKERALNVRQVSHFYSTVLLVMEQVLEPAQVTEVREKLKEYIG